MFKELKPYTEYKDSKNQFLGKVPSSWTIRSLGSLLTPRAERQRPDLQLLSVVREKGVIVRSLVDDDNHNVIPEDLSNYKVVKPGNLVINKMKAWQGSLGVSAHEGIVSPAYFVYDFSLENVRFAHLLLRSRPYVSCFARVSEGVRVGQWDLSIDGMKRIPVLIPSGDEQASIVRFIDYADQRIYQYIQTKQKLIKLLEEQKQSILFQAVTGGINQKISLKKSGIVWVGDIPVHWDIVPNRSLLNFKKKIVGKNSKNYTLLSLSKQGIIERDLTNMEGKIPASFDTYQEINAGDLVFCLFDIDETPRTVGLSEKKGMITGAYTVFQCFDPDVAQYVYYFYLAMDNGKRLKPLYTSLRKVIPKPTFLGAKIPLPPHKEILEILSHIKSEFIQIDSAIERAADEIRLLKEYRMVLTANVVTGKLDVREAVSKLPEVAPIVELDESEDLSYGTDDEESPEETSKEVEEVIT
jgi:type I restriction enzyme, S subunit